MLLYSYLIMCGSGEVAGSSSSSSRCTSVLQQLAARWQHPRPRGRARLFNYLIQFFSSNLESIWVSLSTPSYTPAMHFCTAVVHSWLLFEIDRYLTRVSKTNTHLFLSSIKNMSNVPAWVKVYERNVENSLVYGRYTNIPICFMLYSVGYTVMFKERIKKLT